MTIKMTVTDYPPFASHYNIEMPLLRRTQSAPSNPSMAFESLFEELRLAKLKNIENDAMQNKTKMSVMPKSSQLKKVQELSSLAKKLFTTKGQNADEFCAKCYDLFVQSDVEIKKPVALFPSLSSQGYNINERKHPYMPKFVNKNFVSLSFFEAVRMDAKYSHEPETIITTVPIPKPSQLQRIQELSALSKRIPKQRTPASLKNQLHGKMHALFQQSDEETV